MTDTHLHSVNIVFCASIVKMCILLEAFVWRCAVAVSLLISLENMQTCFIIVCWKTLGFYMEANWKHTEE